MARSKYFANSYPNLRNEEDVDEEVKKNRRRKGVSKTVNRKRTAKTNENKNSNKKKSIKKKKLDKSIETKTNSNIDSDDEKDDDDNWEEVEDAKIFVSEDYNPKLSADLKISLDISKKSKQKTDWVETYIRQKINKMRRDTQYDMHKCHLLLSIHQVRYLNSLILQPEIQARALSMIDSKIAKLKLKPSKLIIEFSKWFDCNFDIWINKLEQKSCTDSLEELISTFETKKIYSSLIFNLAVVSILRALKFTVRICFLLNSLPTKPSNEDLLNRNSKLSKNDSTCNVENSFSSQDYYWIEIFFKKEQKWSSFDLFSKIFEDSKKIASKIKTPITYILAIDNENYVADVTPRYALDWVSYSMKKRRVDDDWWNETLSLVKRKKYSNYEDADQIEFDQLMANVEIPKKYSEFKNHPLFVLEKDLLKFQAIYPSDSPPLASFRNQPVYSRSCVHTLKSRETWLRDARVVLPNEKPYKIVPSKFKWKKIIPGETPVKEMLDVFGYWQTKQYEPPVCDCSTGIVPRNAYGNVDLYQSCMLPIGTVHLKLPGLVRISNKLNIDCVPAIVGFEGAGKGAHPVIDGFIVCYKNKQILIDAWNEEQIIQKEKEQKKRLQRIYGNWKRLIRGLIIKRNLRVKYG